MPAEFTAIFAALKSVMAEQESGLAVQKDTPTEYSLVTKHASPFPQHKGHPMWFGAVKLGKAYVSFHLMPLYMSPTLGKEISPGLKKRMQGKTCFNFKTLPDPELIADLKRLTAVAARAWTGARSQESGVRSQKSEVRIPHRRPSARTRPGRSGLDFAVSPKR